MKPLISNGKLRLRNGALALAVAAAVVVIPPGSGPTAISIVSLPNQITMQRRGTSRPVPVGFNVTGPAGTSVEARIVDLAGNAVVDWTVVGSSGTDGNGNGAGSLLAPQGGWYKLQVRVAGSQTLVAADTSKFGVGAIWLLYGQSNMVNATANGTKPPIGDTRSTWFDYGDKTYRRVGVINGTGAPNTISGQPGFPTSPAWDGMRAEAPTYFTNMLVAKLGVPVCVVNLAEGGKTIAQLTTGTYWDRLATAVANMGGDFEGTLWHQGESEPASQTTAYMVGALGTMHAKLRTLAGRDDSNFRFAIISLGPSNKANSYGANVDYKMGRMRAADVQYANSTPGAFLASCAHDAPTGDGIHMGAPDFGRIWRRVGMSTVHSYGLGTDGAGPRIASATRSANVITVTVQHTGGTALVDGAGGSGAALKGFEVRDNGVLVAISGTAITGANTITLTLVATPAGPVTLEYAMQNAPHATDPNIATDFIIASVPYDNITYVNGAEGAPLQPCAAITVTGA